jgi:hypothetical protein
MICKEINHFKLQNNIITTSPIRNKIMTKKTKYNFIDMFLIQFFTYIENFKFLVGTFFKCPTIDANFCKFAQVLVCILRENKYCQYIETNESKSSFSA